LQCDADSTNERTDGDRTAAKRGSGLVKKVSIDRRAGRGVTMPIGTSDGL
jgi:hypothetical protein